MAKIVPVSIVQSISGKICQHDDIYFATNKQTGKVFAVKICNPSITEPTEKQTAHRKDFGEKTKIAAAWLKANRPTVSTPQGSETYQLMIRGYKAQRKFGSIMSYIRVHIDKDGKVTFGGITSSIPGTTNPGDVTEG